MWRSPSSTGTLRKMNRIVGSLTGTVSTLDNSRIDFLPIVLSRRSTISLVALSLPPSSQGAETTKSHVPGSSLRAKGESARIKRANRVKLPFLSAISCIALRRSLVAIIEPPRVSPRTLPFQQPAVQSRRQSPDTAYLDSIRARRTIPQGASLLLDRRLLRT